MRFAVIVFSLVLLFAQTYAHAILFVPAVSGALIRTSAGQFIKVASKKAFAGAVIGASAKAVNDYCKKTKKCDDIIENASELFGDDDSNDNQKSCISRKYTVLDGSNTSIAEFNSFGDAMAQLKDVVSQNYRDVSYDNDFADQKNKEFTGSTNSVKKGSNLDYSQAPVYIRGTSKKTGVTQSFSYYIKMSYQIDCDDEEELNYVCPVYGYMGNPAQSARYYCSNYGGGSLNSKNFIKNGNVATLNVSCKSRDTNIHCTKNDKKDKELTQEQIQKIVNNMSDDDVTYIINNYGDDIEIQKYCSQNACDELSNEFGQEVQNNQNKYNIDKINKANCVVKNGKIVSCDNAKIEQDEETEETTEESNENEQETDETKKDDDKSCDGNELYKKMCEFMKWYQNDDEPDDTKIDIKDNDEPLQNKKVDFVGACPPKYEINFTLKMGSFYSQDINIMLLDTPKLCNFLDDWIKPIMLFLGPLHAVYILGRKE